MSQQQAAVAYDDLTQAQDILNREYSLSALLPQHTSGVYSPPPIVYEELEKRLNSKQRQALVQRFTRQPDVTFRIEEHHPVLQKYYTLCSDFLDARPQAIITPLLSTLAANVGNKVYTLAFGKKVFCNIWTILMGPSSIARKSTCLYQTLGPLIDYDEQLEQEYAQKLQLYEEGVGEEPHEQCILLPDATAERTVELLAQNPNGLIVHEEIAAWLAKLSKTYNGDLIYSMTGWYDTPERQKVQTMQRKGKKGVVLKRPCFSLAMATTRSWLLKQLDPRDFDSGFMQRFLVCEVNDIAIQDINCRILEGESSSQRANTYLAMLYNGLRQIGTIEHPYRMRLSESAKDLHETVNRQVLSLVFDGYQDTLLSFWSRTFTGYFLRLCMLFQLLEYIEWCYANENPIGSFMTDLEVSETTAAYALRLCHYFFFTMKNFLMDELGEKQNPEQQKIVDVFKEHSGDDNTLTRSFLLSYTKFSKRKFDETIETLMEMGVIEKRMIKSSDKAKRAQTVYTYLLAEWL